MFQTTFISVLLVLLIGSSSCAAVKENNPLSPYTSALTQNVPADMLITLERGGCDGSCPIYKLEISADGRIVYEGKKFVRVEGRVEDKISQEQLRGLLSEFAQADYFSLKDRYLTAEDGCPTTWTDDSSAKTSIRIDGKTKSISHDYGCREKPPDKSFAEIFPRALTKLERRIDEIIGTKRWIE